MVELIKEEKERLKNHIIDYLNSELERDKKSRKQSVDSCDINYFNGCIDTLECIKLNIQTVIFT